MAASEVMIGGSMGIGPTPTSSLKIYSTKTSEKTSELNGVGANGVGEFQVK